MTPTYYRDADIEMDPPSEPPDWTEEAEEAAGVSIPSNDLPPSLAMLPPISYLGPEKPRREVAGMVVCIEPLHTRTADLVVAVYVTKTTRYVHQKRAAFPWDLHYLFENVCNHLTDRSQIENSRLWRRDPDLSGKR